MNDCCDQRDWYYCWHAPESGVLRIRAKDRWDAASSYALRRRLCAGVTISVVPVEKVRSFLVGIEQERA